MTTVTGTPSPRVARALQTLTDARAQLLQIRKDREAAASVIRREIAADTNLSADGRRAAERDRLAQLGASTTSAINQLRAEVEAAAATVATQVERTWPKPTAGVEGMLSRQVAWSRASSLLAAGIPPNRLIAETTDPEALFALRDELPTWARAKHGITAQDAQAFAGRVDHRLAEVIGGTIGADFTAGIEARALVAGLAPMLTQATAEADGRTGDYGLGAALAGRLAEQAVRAADVALPGDENAA